MDNYENEELRQEHENIPAPQENLPEQEVSEMPPLEQPVQEQAAQGPETVAEVYQEPAAEHVYRGAGVGRKESPFADSPYVVTPRPVSQQPRVSYETPVPPQKPAMPKTKKERKGFKRVLAAALALVVLVGSCGITAALVNNRWQNETRAMTAAFNKRLDEMQKQIDAAGENAHYSGETVVAGENGGMTPGQVYAKNVRSVVLITCEVTVTNMYGQPSVGSSAGSGFILSENGYIVTNNHVVDGATAIYVDTHDGQQYNAQLVGADSVNDVAVLKVEAEGLQAVTVGSSSALSVGDQVVAIGNPLGELTATMTAGYVSAMDRDVTTDGRTINMIQTDAAINSGNSGGPLFNMKGEVVGITTAKYSGESASGATIEGIGFAIPMDDVIGMVDDLVNYGYVTGAYLGVMVTDMDPVAAEYYGMPVGARVEEVTPGYCAEEAGLRAKDIIVALGEYEVRNISTLTRALRNFKAGDTTTITVFRGGEKLVLDITLDEKPASTPSQEIPQEGDMPQDGSYDEWFDYFFGGQD